MSWGQGVGVDPVHLRELAEARAERFERLREARERFGEPVVARRNRATHAACGWRLDEAVEASCRSAYVNRAVFPYDAPRVKPVVDGREIEKPNCQGDSPSPRPSPKGRGSLVVACCA
jgi:hypothetical protein